MKKLLTLFLALMPWLAFADFPPNNLDLEDNLMLEKSATGVTEAKFRAIVSDMQKLYAPIVAAHGGVLTINPNWADSTVNAYATQNGSDWHVEMFGGLARRPEITEDGFRMVVCHELGHHLGGFAFYGPYDWAAVEGQADYFANQVCAKKVFGVPDTVLGLVKYKAAIPKKMADKCDDVYYSQMDRAVCYRSFAGGQSLANLLARMSMERQPSIDTPSTSVVRATYKAHPRAQCRLDTYIAASLCVKKFDDAVIPGLNHPDNQDSLGAELEAYKYSCAGSNVGARPRCWFFPRQ